MCTRKKTRNFRCFFVIFPNFAVIYTRAGGIHRNFTKLQIFEIFDFLCQKKRSKNGVFFTFLKNAGTPLNGQILRKKSLFFSSKKQRKKHVFFAGFKTVKTSKKTRFLTKIGQKHVKMVIFGRITYLGSTTACREKHPCFFYVEMKRILASQTIP